MAAFAFRVPKEEKGKNVRSSFMMVAKFGSFSLSKFYQQCPTWAKKCICLEVIHITFAERTRNCNPTKCLERGELEIFKKNYNDSHCPLINKTIMSVTRKDSGHYGHLSAMFTQAWHPINRPESTSTARDPTQREWKRLTCQNCPYFPPESAGFHVLTRIFNALSYLNFLLTPKEQRNFGGDEI